MRKNRPISRLLALACGAALVACAQDPGAARRDGVAEVGPSELQDVGPPADASAGADASLAVDSGLDAAIEQPWLSDSGVDGGAADASTSDDASPTPTGIRTALVAPGLWLPLDPAQDPFTDRPSLVSCPPSSMVAELLSGEPAFSVETGDCTYLTVKQASARAVAVGEIIKVRLWHFELSAPEPAEAHAAVLVDGQPVLDERVTIPAAGGLISRQLRVTRAIPAGAPVHFHLHNHGMNSWSLVEVSAGP